MRDTMRCEVPQSRHEALTPFVRQQRDIIQTWMLVTEPLELLHRFEPELIIGPKVTTRGTVSKADQPARITSSRGRGGS